MFCKTNKNLKENLRQLKETLECKVNSGNI